MEEGREKYNGCIHSGGMDIINNTNELIMIDTYLLFVGVVCPFGCLSFSIVAFYQQSGSSVLPKEPVTIPMSIVSQSGGTNIMLRYLSLIVISLVMIVGIVM